MTLLALLTAGAVAFALIYNPAPPPTPSATPSTPAPPPDLHAGAAYGDSTTQGDGVDPANRWTTLLAEKSGWPIDNFGANGATAEEIAARWGSITPTGTPIGGLIPESGPVTLKLDINPLRSGLDNPTLDVDLYTSGQVIRGTLTRAGDDLIFTRTEPGPAITTSHVGVKAVIPEPRRDGLLILAMGINNEPGLDKGTQTISQIEGLYKGVTNLHRGRLIVWGMLDRGLDEGPGTTRGKYIADLETWLAEQYGPDFVPVRQYLASHQALTDAAAIDPGFTPTDEDLACAAAGCVPPSFRIAPTSAHLNDLGHRLQADLFYNHMQKNGPAS